MKKREKNNSQISMRATPRTIELSSDEEDNQVGISEETEDLEGMEEDKSHDIEMVDEPSRPNKKKQNEKHAYMSKYEKRLLKFHY